MILAGDIGGTKTLLGLFDERRPRPSPIVIRAFATPEFSELTAIITAFAAELAATGRNVAAAAFGVAGPVSGRTATLTNLPFHIDADAVERAFGIPRVALLNDLEATAHSVRVLEDTEIRVLQAGSIPRDGGSLGIIAAGTGFNEALIHHAGGGDTLAAAEAGHADWAARNEREILLLRDLIQRYGRAEVEHVVSGPGLVNIHRITHDGGCPSVDGEDDPDAPAKISRAALDRRCRGCVEALHIFVDAYGAEAGNLALRAFTTGGVFVGGGIAPKILPLLTDGRFMRAFLDKGSFRDMLIQVPVRVILNAEAGLIGAAIAAMPA